MNIAGQLVKTVQSDGGEISIDVADLPGGVYIIRVRSEEGVMVGKFVKE